MGEQHKESNHARCDLFCSLSEGAVALHVSHKHEHRRRDNKMEQQLIKAAKNKNSNVELMEGGGVIDAAI